MPELGQSPLLGRVRAAFTPHYEVERELGSGGMGVVFLARDRALDRLVAIKILKPELATADGVGRFLREAKTLAQVRHPNVVVVHTSGDMHGLFHLVMEYLPGETLAERLVSGPLGPTGAARLGLDLLHGVEAVHRAQIVHRDIKPGNVFLMEDRAILADFGIARKLAPGSADSSTGRVIGTPLYMAPEQSMGGPPTPRSDLYAIGTVVYEGATGRRWAVHSASGKPDWSGVPRPMARVLARALRWDPLERWPDAASFRKALARALAPRLAVRIGAAVVISLLGFWAWTWIRPLRPPALQPVDLAVLAFRGPDSVEAIRLSRFVGVQLEPFGRLSIRPTTMSLATPWPHSPAEAAALRARFYVEGELDQPGTLDLAVRDSTGQLYDRFTVRRGTDDLTWGYAAADSLVRRVFRAHYSAYRAVAGLGGSRDPAAVEAFLQGDEAFQRDAYRLAESHFQRALDYDPDFAVAAWHLALAHRWLRVVSETELRHVAERHRARLPPHYQQLLDAQLEHNLERRFGRYRDAIAASPEAGHALLIYADELFHRGPLLGIPLDTALAYMTRAAELDPYLDQASALDHLIWGNGRLGRRRAAREAVERREAIVALKGAGDMDESQSRSGFLRLAYYARFVPWKARIALAWRFRDPSPALLATTAEYVRLGLSFDVAEVQLGLGRIMVEHAPAESLAAQGHQAQGLALMLLGRPRAAVAQFDSAARLFGTSMGELQSAQWRLIPGLLGMPQSDSAEAAQARAHLERLAEDTTVRVSALWTLALLARARGQGGVADSLQARLAEFARHDSAAARLTGLLEAERAGRADSFEIALGRSAPLLEFNPIIRAGDPFARAFLYLRRAAWLERLGRLEDARLTLGWSDNSDVDGWAQQEAQAGDIDAAMSAIAWLRLASVELRSGQQAKACRKLRRLTGRWEKAEPEYRPLRDEAARLLGACQG